MTMTDEQKNKFFKSIQNFDLFIEKINSRKSIELLNENKIVFQKNGVLIIFEEFREQLNNQEFLNFMKEMIEQKIQEFQHILNKVHENIEFERRNKVIFIADKKYKVENEYLNAMNFSRDIASGQDFYKKQLLRLVKLIESGNLIVLNNKCISTITELEAEIENWNSFKNIDDEIG